MFPPNTAAWIAIGLLAPFWWGLGLFILASLGDVSARWRPGVSRLFDRLERGSGASRNERAPSHPAAA